MVCLSDKFQLVDLYTFDRRLEDLMLSEYPETIFPEQYKIGESEPDRNGPPKCYCFYGLFPSTINSFLKGKDFEYELRDSRTGEVLKVNRQS